jgi:hypothetical protein
MTLTVTYWVVVLLSVVVEEVAAFAVEIAVDAAWETGQTVV